jgi:signal transduction histidine kinase
MADWQLQRALTEIAADFSKGTDTTITVDIDATAAARLSAKAADVVQLAREALSNAVRHAHATRIDLTLHQQGTTAVLCVADDGAGFDPDAALGTGHGLLNLGERAHAVGGLLDLTSKPGKGTKVTVEIPL